MSGNLNVVNRTLFTGDNLDIMRGMNSDCVDLIYLDPPFNSNQTYAAPIGSKAAGAAFKDTWTLDDVDLAWHGQIAEDHPELYAIIDAAGVCHGKSMKAYLIMMGVRLLEMRRILRDTGSIYLHCDPTASHYLKMVMDAVFGADSFRNEVIWHYRRWTAGNKNFQRMHDVILRYTRSDKATFNVQFEPYGDWIKKDYKYVDPNTGKRWRWHTVKGKRYKVFLDDPDRGVKLNDVWIMPHLGSTAKERLGYPTQKPLTLLNRIISASSNIGDVVLDPFCGCATACVAAEHLQREWIGIDLSEKAADLVRDRLSDASGIFGRITHRHDIPVRTDVKSIKHYTNYKHELYGQQEGVCNGCHVHFPFRNLTVDHIIPQSKGGQGNVDNLQLLCGACNSMKGNRPMEVLLARLSRIHDTNIQDFRRN